MSERISKKIALVGTSCTYKTAILKQYKTRYKGDSRVAFVDEAARQFFSTNNVDDRFSENTQERIQDLVLKLESNAQRFGILRTFCDRSVLDAPAYSRGLGDIEVSKRLLARVSFWLSSYDSIVLLDPSKVPYHTDKERTETPEERELYHQGFLSMFQEESIPYEFVSGTLLERVEQIDHIADIKALD